MGRRTRKPKLWPSRFRRHPILLIVALLVAILTALQGIGRQGGDLDRYHNRTFRVVRVVDGDTLDVGVPDRKHPHTRIRLWGVDTPEVAGSPAGEMYFGPEASAFTRATMLDKDVRIELVEGDTRGKYGRLLAYVYLVDSNEMLNELLLERGLAYADPRFEHPRLLRFRQMERRAERNGVGLWADVTPEQYPSWKRRRK